MKRYNFSIRPKSTLQPHRLQLEFIHTSFLPSFLPKSTEHLSFWVFLLDFVIRFLAILIDDFSFISLRMHDHE